MIIMGAAAYIEVVHRNRDNASLKDVHTLIIAGQRGLRLIYVKTLR